MKIANITVIPAHPGHELIYKDSDQGEFTICGSAIAWRITTHTDIAGNVFSMVDPLIAEGDAGENCIGVKNPDGSVRIFHDGHYPSWEAFVSDKQPAV